MVTQPESGLATFFEDLEVVSIISGTKLQWTLPNIDPGTGALTEVRFNADPLISEYLKYNSDTNVVVYDGRVINALTGPKFVRIGLSLVNNVGENLFTQLVTVLPDPDLSSTPEPELDQNAPTTEEPTSEAIEGGTGIE